MSDINNSRKTKSVTDTESLAIAVKSRHSGPCEREGCDESLTHKVWRDDGFEKRLCIGHTRAVTQFIDEVYEIEKVPS